MSANFGLCSLPRPARFYIYGIQGLFYEILFTCLYELVTNGNRQLHGYSSIYSFFIYGSCALVTEHVFLKMYSKSLLQRLIFYVPIVYLWEYGSGLVLSQFDACTWNYAHYKYNIHGLITLEYLPGWVILSVFSDCVYKIMMRVQLTADGGAKQA